MLLRCLACTPARPPACSLAAAQVVSLHCNLDANTRHLMNAERLNMMKRDAVLVNAARGACVDEVALVAHGRIRSASLIASAGSTG